MAESVTGKRGVLRNLIVVGVLAALSGWLVWWKFYRELPQPLADGSMEEYFKYGSIGTEYEKGIPYWIWLVLPKMFPEYLPGPGGWASLGLGWEQGREMPVGFSKKTIGYERVGINCAFCHSAKLRKATDFVPRIYLGAPGPTVDVLAYQRFLFAAASDPRFNAGNILEEIAQIYELPPLDRLLYRFVLIPATRKALLKQRDDFAWTATRPAWGRGRIDLLNLVKVRTLGVGVADTIGTSDMQPIWNMKLRVEGKMALHWDGLNTDVTEVFLSSAIGDGATPQSLPVAKLKELETWAMELQPPKFEDLFALDHELAAAGKPIYQEHCAECHDVGGEKTGQVLMLTEAQWRVEDLVAGTGPRYTDPHRAEMWAAEAADAYNAYADGYDWSFQKFRSTGGYVNVPLDGLWIRAPYLHNGSVPYLDEVLEPADQRTRVFYRGYEVYDPRRTGFISEGSEAKRVGTRYDTLEPGNSNRGHLWGTELAPGKKAALLEYLKTL
jgi:mono/diheme cytochrome c family protein